MRQMTKEQAIAFGETKAYEVLTDRQIVELQLFQDKLCMPFDVFHEATEKVLSRPVFTHEFAHPESLRKEMLGERPAPSFDEILALIPKEKLLIIGL
jgi:hypothetical protein